MAMKPNNMVGYVPTASWWISGNRTDCSNGGTWRDNIYGGEAEVDMLQEMIFMLLAIFSTLEQLILMETQIRMNLVSPHIIGKMDKYSICQEALFMITIGSVEVEILLQ